MDTSPFTQHETVEGIRYRGGPPSGGLSHVPASHNAANASDNHGEPKICKWHYCETTILSWGDFLNCYP